MFVTHFSLLLFGLVLKGLKTFDVDILYHNPFYLFLLPAEVEEVLDLQERVAEEEADEAPALGDVRQEGVRPELLRHLHYHYRAIIIIINHNHVIIIFIIIIITAPPSWR